MVDGDDTYPADQVREMVDNVLVKRADMAIPLIFTIFLVNMFNR